MKALTHEEARAWCEKRHVRVTRSQYLYFDTPQRLCMAFELPEKPYQLVALANALLPYSESLPFLGALLWIRQWGVWSELVERCGLRVMEVMRMIHGDGRPLQEAPGYLFDSQELIDLEVSFVQPMLVGWDAFLVPECGEYIVATSHDEVTCVLSRTPETHERMLSELQPWNPREGGEWYFKGIGAPAEDS